MRSIRRAGPNEGILDQQDPVKLTKSGLKLQVPVAAFDGKEHNDGLGPAHRDCQTAVLNQFTSQSPHHGSSETGALAYRNKEHAGHQMLLDSISHWPQPVWPLVRDDGSRSLATSGRPQVPYPLLNLRQNSEPVLTSIIQS